MAITAITPDWRQMAASLRSEKITGTVDCAGCFLATCCISAQVDNSMVELIAMPIPNFDN